MVEDTFTRANNADLGTNWTPVSNTMRVVSNAARGAAVQGVDCCERWNAAEFSPDQWAQCRIQALAPATDGHGTGPAVRCSATAFTNYNVICRTGATELWTVQAGTFTKIASGAAVSVGDLVRLEAIGESLFVRVNNAVSPLLAITSSVAVAGYPGLEAFEAAAETAIADDFSAGDMPPQRSAMLVPWNSRC